MWLYSVLLEIDLEYPGSCARRFIVASELREIWIFPFSIDHWVRNPPWIFLVHNLNDIYKVCVLFPSPMFILSIVHTVKVFKYYFVFMSIFIFHIICSSSKKHPLANRSLVRTLSLEGVTLGCKPLFWISDNLSEILKT